MALKIKKTGMGVIRKNIGKFQSIIAGLDKGIGLCDKEQTKNNKVIKTLDEKNKTIQESKTQAVVFRDNLSNMLKNPAVVEDVVEETTEETIEDVVEETTEEKKEDK